MGEPAQGLSRSQAAVKRTMDITVSAAGLILSAPVLLVALGASWASTREAPIFTQVRVGRRAGLFRMSKVRTMRSAAGPVSNVTQVTDPRITRVGAVLRLTKLDELPQLVNVLLGHMSLVGPRPDVPGWADELSGDDRIVLEVRPGITGPASIAFRKEEIMLAEVSDPDRYNREVIWPQKVALNRAYVENWSAMSDIRYLVQTVLAVVRDDSEAALGQATSLGNDSPPVHRPGESW